MTFRAPQGEERPAQPRRLPLGLRRSERIIRGQAHYRRPRDEHGDWHSAALRNLFNRMLGQLYHCLQRRELFDERTAFPTELATAA